MNIDAIKLELIDWIAQLNDKKAINMLMTLKKKLSTPKSKTDSKIYRSGKDLVDYIAEDFNEPLDEFKDYQK